MNRFPLCQLVCLLVSLSVLFGIGFKYHDDYKGHIRTREYALSLKEEICNFPDKIEKLHMFPQCHDAFHDLQVDPYEMANTKFYKRWSLDGWLLWGGQYFLSIIGLLLTMFVLLMAKGPLEWALNRIDDYTQPLIPINNDPKKYE